VGTHDPVPHLRAGLWLWCDGLVFFAVFLTFRHPEQSIESRCDWLHMTPAFDKMEIQNYLCDWPVASTPQHVYVLL
jgi:hypothetical protein